MDIEIKRINPTLNELYEIELLRNQVFHLKTDDVSIKTSYSIFHAIHQRLIPFGLKINGKLIAGIYVTCLNDSLFIDSIFVHEDYQKSELKIGKKLINAVLAMKPIFEEYYKKEIHQSKLTAKSTAREFYEKVGYEKEERTPYMVKKI